MASPKEEQRTQAEDSEPAENISMLSIPTEPAPAYHTVTGLSEYPQESEDEFEAPSRDKKSDKAPRNNWNFIKGGMNDRYKRIALIAGALLVSLLIILISLSFADLEYNEFGFRKRKTTGAVDMSHVYGPGGRHMVGPDIEFKKFRADGHFVNLKKLTVFTSNKLEVTVTAHCQYYLRKEDLPLLHKEFDIYYEPILELNLKNGLKNAASKLSREEFVQERAKAEKILFEGVRETLGGICCVANCEETNSCVRNCKKTDCTVADKGLFAEVRYFQLLEVDVPDDVQKNYLRAIVVHEEGARERFMQDVAVAEKETEAQVELIQNKAAEISQNATAEASLIQSKAKARASAIVELARSNGLKNLYKRIGLTSEEHKSSFDYLRTLQRMNNVHLGIDFNSLIMYNGPKQ